MGDESPLSGLTLRNLPLPSRLVLSCFLGAIGLGYFTALVQLHFNGGAKPGQPIPGPDEAVQRYFGHTGDKPMSRLERLIITDESEPFNGTGSMRRAFKDKSQGWAKKLRAAKEAGTEKQLYEERTGEADAVVAWIQGGADEKEYEKDEFVLPGGARTISSQFVVMENQKPAEPFRVKIKSILTERCACCHEKDAGRDRNAEKYELDSYPKFAKYLEVKTASAMDLNKLATTTHVHMFGFTIMYCLTGLIFSFTSYPTWARAIVAPAAIVTSVTEIGIGWWLGRLDPCPAAATAAFGAITGGILLVHIFGSLFNMYAKKGKLVLVLLMAGTLTGGLLLHGNIVVPHLEKEKANAAQNQAAK